MSQSPCEWVMPHICEYVTHERMSHTDSSSENQTCGWQLLNLVTRWRTRFFGTLCVLQLLRCPGMLQCVAVCVWSHDGARDSMVQCVCFSCISVPVCCRVCSVTWWRMRFYGSLCVFQLFPNVLQCVAVCVWSHDSALDSTVRYVSCRCCNIAVCCSALQWVICSALQWVICSALQWVICSALQWVVCSALQCFVLCIWSLDGAQDPTVLSVCCSCCSVEWVAECCSAAYVAGVAVLRVLQCIAFRTHDHARDSITHHLEFFVSYTATYCNILQHTATYCNILQHTATRMAHLLRLFVWYTATHFKTLQHTATHWNTLQHTATHCNAYGTPSQIIRVIHYNTLQYTATHCITLQDTAKRCNIWQHTATFQHAFSHDILWYTLSNSAKNISELKVPAPEENETICLRFFSGKKKILPTHLMKVFSMETHVYKTK